MSYAMRSWRHLIVIVFLAVLASVAAPLSAFFFAAIADAMMGVVSIQEPIRDVSSTGLSFEVVAGRLTRWVKLLAGESNFALLGVLTGLFAATSVLVQILRFLSQWFSWVVRTRAFYRLQRDLFSKVLHQSITFFNHQRVGDLMSRVHNDASAATGPMMEILQTVTARLLTVAVYTYFMLQTSPSLTVVILGVGLAAALASNIIGRQVKRYTSRSQSQQAVVTSVIQEAFSSARLVKSFATEDKEIDRFWTRALEHFATEKKVMWLKLLVEHINLIIIILTLSALLVVGGLFTSTGAISIPGFMAFLYVAHDTGKLLAQVATTVVQVYSVLGTSERIVDLLHQESSMVDGGTPKAKFTSGIELRDVTFDYGNGPVLKSINITINKGDFVAFVGPSGSGKSTLVDILLRLQDPTTGQVLMDGEDIRTFTLDTYRRVFGAMSQETTLFNDTITNNIAYGARNIHEGDVEQAAQVAHADEFIKAMPAQYSTFVGDRGARVSGGERQRLAIARALVSQPEVLVFDEATSSLDNRSERRVQQAIDELVGTRTAVVVAHRLSTIVQADCIYVLDQGRVVESGTHTELQETDGLYARLLRLQHGTDVTFLEDPSEKGDNLHE